MKMQLKNIAKEWKKMLHGEDKSKWMHWHNVTILILLYIKSTIPIWFKYFMSLLEVFQPYI